MSDKKPDCILSDGTQVYIDLNEITIQEWRDIWHPFSSEAAGDASIAKITGMKPESVKKLKALDYKRITDTSAKKFREPLADPT